MPMFPSLAVVGALTWILSELVELATGGFSSASVALTGVAFSLLAAGMFGLDGRRAPSRAWRATTALSAAGFAAMTAVCVRMLLSDPGVHPEDALFFTAIGLFAVGLVGMGISALVDGRHPRWLGASFLLVSLGTLAADAAEVALASVVLHIALSLVVVRMAAPQLRTATPARA